LSASAGDGQVALSWTASSGASYYNVYRWNGSSYAFDQSTTATSFTDTGLTDGTTYWYEVTAVNNGGESGPSNQISATPQAAVSYSLSASPGAVAPGGSITVAWTGPAGHSTSDWVGLFAVGTPNTSYLAYQYTTSDTGGTMTFTAPSAPGSYEFRYLPNDGYTSAVSSNSVQVVAPATAPANLTATAGNAQVALSWTGSSDAISYNVYRWNGTSYAFDQNTTGTSFTDTGLVNGTSYSYEVTALNSIGSESGLSNSASATPQAPVTKPAVPTGLTVIVGDTQVSLSWTPSAGATSYNLYRSTTTGKETLYQTGLAEPSFTDSGLANGTKYFYQVVAVNGAGSSTRSSQTSATPSATHPLAPTNMTATASNGQITLSWSPVSGATYRIYRSTSLGGEGATAYKTGLKATSFTDTGLTNGVTYYYQITAVNRSGSSAKSTEAFATPAAGLFELLAGTPQTDSHAAALDQEQLDRIVAEAIQLWKATGLSAAQVSALQQARFLIADLPAGVLGDTVGKVVYIDRTADGYGWSVGGQVAPDKVDLLTVVSHELGNILGLPELDPLSNPGNVMDRSLAPGVRRLPG
jgi:fibronectin type 3 domain-containing protein